VTREEFDQFCTSLAHTTHVVQWGGASVWKIGGKVFAIGGWDGPNLSGVTFKASRHTFELLKDRPGMRPAPYMAARGMTWLQRTGPETLDDDALRDYLHESDRLAAATLTKAKRKDLGLLDRTGSHDRSSSEQVLG